jgi:hypothetical protein
VSGHDFSRAATASDTTWALAPEVDFWEASPLVPLFPQSAKPRFFSEHSSTGRGRTNQNLKCDCPGRMYASGSTALTRCQASTAIRRQLKEGPESISAESTVIKLGRLSGSGDVALGSTGHSFSGFAPDACASALQTFSRKMQTHCILIPSESA